MGEEYPRRPGRPPGAVAVGGLARIGIGNAFVLVMMFGTMFVLWQRELFDIWLRAVVATGVIVGAIYILLLISRKRITGTGEILFVLGSLVIFIFLLQPEYQKQIPFTITALDVADTSGQAIMPISTLYLIFLAIALVAVWKGKVLERLGVKL